MWGAPHIQAHQPLSSNPDQFTLKSDAHGSPVGALQIAVRWRHPFRRQRELGPRSLSGLETETLIKAFSDGEVAAGLVNYRDFCRFIDPPRDVLRAIERLRAFASRMGEKEHRKPREIFKILLDKFDAMKVDVFVAKLLKVRRGKAPPAPRAPRPHDRRDARPTT